MLKGQKSVCKSPMPDASPRRADAVAPSAIHYGELDYAGQNLITPRELTTDEVKALVQAFKDSVKRAVEAGFDN